MANTEWTIKLTAGNGYNAPLSFFDDADLPVDLDGSNIRFIIDDGVLEWSTANGKVVVTGPGQATLSLSSADVAACGFEFANYEWRVVWSDTTSEEILSGKVWKES